LESRFLLNSKLVGIMPFGDRPPAGAGKEMWDGICLVLITSKPEAWGRHFLGRDRGSGRPTASPVVDCLSGNTASF